MGNVMNDLTIRVEAPYAVYPAITSPRRSMFISNIDQMLVAPVGTLSFFDKHPDMEFEAVVKSYEKALSQLLVTYDFMGGRLKRNNEGGRLEIDCNGAGALFAVASCNVSRDDLGDITTPILAFRGFVLCEKIAPSHRSDLPLFTLQATRLTCGGFVVGAGLNRCLFDDISCLDMMKNLASIASCGSLNITPIMDRTVLRARNPPQFDNPHYEFSPRGQERTTMAAPVEQYVLNVFSISGERIQRLLEETGRGCTSFELVTAMAWKAWTVVLAGEYKMNKQEMATVLFPVDVRGSWRPVLSRKYAGNAVMPAHARALVREVVGMTVPELVEKVKEGISRLSKDYVKSAVDWLEVNRRSDSGVRRLSVVLWRKLGRDDMRKLRFPWGIPIHCGPLVFSPAPDLLVLLPQPDGDGLKLVISLLPSQKSIFKTAFPGLLSH